LLVPTFLWPNIDIICNFSKSFFTTITLAPIDIDPMFNFNYVEMGTTGAPFATVFSSVKKIEQLSCRYLKRNQLV